MIRLFRNIRNGHKYIEVKRYNDGHYVWRQFIYTNYDGHEVKNYTGCKKASHGRWFRNGKKSIMAVVTSDYIEVQEIDRTVENFMEVYR